jgi:hypothetical protein
VHQGGDTRTHAPARARTHTHTHTHTQVVNPEGDVVMAHVADCQQRRLVEVRCSIVCVYRVCVSSREAARGGET